jgi:hypothetical protein
VKPVDADRLTRYRSWFVAAAIYNALWGSVVVCFPAALFRMLGLPAPTDATPWQVVGMFVLVYAPAYWWVSRQPSRHAHLVLVALLGKLCGPIGFVYAIAMRQLPLAFGWTILTNDLIWWPVFAFFLRDAARLAGGWSHFLRGEGSAESLNVRLHQSARC